MNIQIKISVATLLQSIKVISYLSEAKVKAAND